MKHDVPMSARSARPGPRRLLRTALASVLGLALAAPGVLIAPAQAGLLDPITDPLTPILDPVTGLLLTAPTPVIAQGEAGSIQLLGQVVCTSDGGTEKLCEPLPLGVLGPLTGVTSVLLEAVPADPADVPTWDLASCPGAIGALCTIPLGDLLTATPPSPVVVFDPAPGGSETAPQTKITSAAPGSYATAHTFTFSAEPAAPTTAYACRLQVTFRGTPPAGAETGEAGWTPCGEGTTGTRRYADLAPADYVFAVQAAGDPTPATQSFRLSVPPVPATSIVSGPRSGAWLLGNRVTYTFRSTVAGSAYACRIDGQGTTCAGGRWTRQGLAPGTHRFTVTARANGVSDPSPAGRVFHVPFDDRQLRGVGRWVDGRQRGAFRSTVRATRVRGAGLATRGRLPMKRVVLVAGKGRGHGTVKVYLGNRLLRKVSLHARRAQTRAVIPVASFRAVRTGRIRVVVVSSGRPVRIDGLGISRR